MTVIPALNPRALALRGIVAIIFGLIAFFIPAVTLFALTILFGAYALIDGVVSIAAAIHAARHGDRWWAFVFEGIAGLVAAAVTMIWPVITLAVLVYLIAGWAIVTGVLEIAAAIRLRRHISGEWLLVVVGIASIVFGVLLFSAPGVGAVVLALWMGAYIFVFGVLMLALAFRLRHSTAGSFQPRHA